MVESPLNVVLIEHEEMWSAQCLQFDIGAQAPSLHAVIDELQRSIAGYVAICHELSVEPFVNLPAAPAKYWKMWEKSKASIHSEIATPRIPDKGSRMPRTEIKVAA